MPQLSLLLCCSDAERRAASWYYVSDRSPVHTPHRDARNRQSREWLKLVRGEAQFSRFSYEDAQQTIPGEVDSLLEEFRLQKTHLGYFIDGGSFPGVLEVSAQ